MREPSRRKTVAPDHANADGGRRRIVRGALALRQRQATLGTMRARRRLAFALALVACGGDDAGANAEARSAIRGGSGPGRSSPREASDGEEPAPEVPYDQAIQKSVHNAYARAEPLLDQLVYHRVRSLELDIHTRRSGSIAPPGDWFVFHEDSPISRQTSCARLSDCLGQLSAFDEALPRHEVVTLFVDLKTEFEQGHSAADLDAAFVEAIGQGRLVTPADVIAACPGAATLRDAVTGHCRFPTLRALRGKFIVAVTGGTSCDPSSMVASYAGRAPKDRAAFVAPDVDGSCTVASYDARPDVVFFNMPLAEKARASEVKRRGLVARIYGGGMAGGLDGPSDFAAAKAAGAAHLATDKVNFDQDAWALSHRPRGYPFTCNGCRDDLVEPGQFFGVRGTSGDLWGTSDSGVFAVETDNDETVWSALVSVPSSHVEPFAKACLVARAGADPGAINVAVCRTFDDNAPRAQVRTVPSGSTTATKASTFDGITTESGAFLRLAIKRSSAGSEVTSSVSQDGRSWSTITTTTVSVPLPLRGVAVSGHGLTTVKGLFANLTRERGGVSTPMSTSTLVTKAIGVGAAGDSFDGLFPR